MFLTSGCLLLLIGVGASLLQAEDKFDKDEFLARKKWYVTFAFRLKGKGAATRTEGLDQWKITWDILREVTGTFEFDKVGQNGPRDSTLATGERYQGRYISWGATTGVSSINYLVADLVKHESVTHGEHGAATRVHGFTKLAGAGSTQMGRPKELNCDLKDMVFDLQLDDLAGRRNLAGVKALKLTGEYHDYTPATKVRKEIVYPIGEFDIDGLLPNLEPLREQLRSRPLQLVKGKFEFSVSMEVPTLPRFPNHSGNVYRSRYWYNDFATAGGPPLILSLDVIISPTPPSRAKLILEPEPAYRAGADSWRPLCSDSETVPGNSLKVDWRVEEEGGDPARPTKVHRVMFSLLNTSKEPGVCMNYPLVPLSPAEYDLGFATGNPIEGYRRAQDGQKLTLADAQVNARKGTVTVDCFDSGASGVLVAEAELEDGRVLRAVVGSTEEPQLMIPDFEPGKSFIAKAWREKNAPGKPDKADDENFPKGDGQVGDGLTVWEEYRGFWVGGKWDGNCDPKTKDLFIDSPNPELRGGIWLFASITQLRVHELLKPGEHRVDRVINFNKGDRPHLVDQHCLVLSVDKDAAADEPESKTHTSYTVGVKGTDGPGPPKNSEGISYSPSAISLPTAFFSDEGKRARLALADRTVAHELGHAVGIPHHGDNDEGFRWWSSKRKGNGDIVSILSDEDGSFLSSEEVIVKSEKTGKVMVPADYLPSLADGRRWRIWIGSNQGQSSGDDGCVMHYSIASMYRSASEPKVLYFYTDNTITTNRLCTSAAGNGTNLSTHSPQSRFGDAKARHGDCAHKFVISDRWEKLP